MSKKEKSGLDPVVATMERQLQEMEVLEEKLELDLADLRLRMTAANDARMDWIKAMFHPQTPNLPTKPPATASPTRSTPSPKAAPSPAKSKPKTSSAGKPVGAAQFLAKKENKPKAHNQTWNQWASSLREEFDLPTDGLSQPVPSPLVRFFADQFKKGARPGDARKLWKANAQRVHNAAQDGAAPEVFDGDAWDLNHADMVALAKAAERLPVSGILPTKVELNSGHWAVVAMGDDEDPAKDRFYCQELAIPSENAETFELRKAQTAKGKPIMLSGVGVTVRNPPGDWMFGPRRIVLTLSRHGKEA